MRIRQTLCGLLLSIGLLGCTNKEEPEPTPYFHNYSASFKEPVEESKYKNIVAWIEEDPNRTEDVTDEFGYQIRSTWKKRYCHTDETSLVLTYTNYVPFNSTDTSDLHIYFRTRKEVDGKTQEKYVYLNEERDLPGVLSILEDQIQTNCQQATLNALRYIESQQQSL